MENSMSVEIRDILRNRVKEKLARDEVVASMTVRLVRNIEIARMAASAGFDTLYVDVEHNGFSWDTTGQICMAALAAGITPFVRVPTTASEHVAGALNGGALGVIAPHVRSAADARRVVAAAKFPPLGERSAGGPVPQLQFRPFPASQADPALNDATTVMVMMETLDALEHVEEIAAVDGIDMMMIGTSDLTAEMGIPGQYDDPRVRAAYARTIAACRKHGKHVGVGGLASRPDLTAEFVKLGARYVSTGTDLGFLMSTCMQKCKQVRDLKT
jgi:2-keto-3-deoxy-L-rhamnonate aldolase RhmA